MAKAKIYTFLEQNMLGCMHFGISLFYILLRHAQITCFPRVFIRGFIYGLYISFIRGKVLYVVLYMDLYVFDTYPYTLKSHIPQKEDKRGLTKICILYKTKYTAGDFVR